MFDPHKARPDDLNRAVSGAMSAPQGNRCFLPAEGSVLIPSLIRRFESEFRDLVAHPQLAAAEWVLPKIVDFDEATRTFTYDPHQAFKEPDWTYREAAPAPRPRPSAPSQSPQGPVAIHLAVDLAAQLHALADKEGIGLDREVDRALRHWLAEHK